MKHVGAFDERTLGVAVPVPNMPNLHIKHYIGQLARGPPAPSVRSSDAPTCYCFKRNRFSQILRYGFLQHFSQILPYRFCNTFSQVLRYGLQD